MIYIVLGMHKSGTTLVSQILHQSGINMVDGADTHAGYDKGNKYERSSMVAVNQNLLRSWGRFSLNFGRPSDLELTPAQKKRIRELTRECNAKYEHWGFKDPRMCYSYEFWKPLLPQHKIIAIYRSAEEVWLHYQKGPKRRMLSVTLNLLKRWCEHNEGILNYLKSGPAEAIVMNYERFMNDPRELERLEKFVGRRLKDERNLKLYRSRHAGTAFFKVMNKITKFPEGQTPQEIIRRLDAYASRGSVSL